MILNRTWSRERLLASAARIASHPMPVFFQKRFWQLWQRAKSAFPAVALARAISIGRGR
jgi:hypothetical protein